MSRLIQAQDLAHILQHNASFCVALLVKKPDGRYVSNGINTVSQQRKGTRA